jgi:Cyclin M transmembrane N-terminal domain
VNRVAVLEGAVIVLLLMVNGFLAMSEMAIVSSRRSRLEQLADDGHADARTALALAEDLSRYLAAVQMGMTLISILAGALSGATLADRLEDWLSLYLSIMPYAKPAALGIVVVAVAYLSLIIGELVPKQIALKNPEMIAIRVARPLAIFAGSAAPVVWLLDVSTKFILRLLGLRPGFERKVTDEDIQSLVREAERSGVLHKIEREMVEGVLDLENTLQRRRRVMGSLEPPSSRSQLFFVGKDSRGNWVVQDQQRLRGGLFIARAEALRFAMFENGHRPQAVVMVTGVFELDLSGKPSVVQQSAAQIEAPRARRVPEGLLSFPAAPGVVPA